MRLPLAIASVLLALTFAPVVQAACEGNVTVIAAPIACANPPCAKFYFVMGGPNLALYQESNGVAGLQRDSNPPPLQGGHDNCFTGPNPDTRYF